jgi:transcriptional regulatory protein GAL4
MPASRPVRRSASERACLECQKRKTKYVAAASEGDICAYCQKAGKTCVFEGPHERTSLTRRNLDAAEARCRELERLLQEVKTNTGPDAEQKEATQESASRSVPHRPQSTEDPPAGPYEWNEGLDASANDPSPDGEYTRDGMASLTRQGNGSGYLGEHTPRHCS